MIALSNINLTSRGVSSSLDISPKCKVKFKPSERRKIKLEKSSNRNHIPLY